VSAETAFAIAEIAGGTGISPSPVGDLRIRTSRIAVLSPASAGASGERAAPRVARRVPSRARWACRPRLSSPSALGQREAAAGIGRDGKSYVYSYRRALDELFLVEGLK